ncbi:MAG: LuxR C-terminal-related transcriptional regulator [Bacillota bacterium]
MTLAENNGNIITQRKYSTISFTLFSAWLLSFPFGGRILFSLAENSNIDGSFLSFLAAFAHFIGLFSGGFFIKKQLAAKMTMIFSTVICISGSLIFFLPFSFLWYIAIVSIAFFAAYIITSWAYYYKNYSSPKQRIKTAADVIIISNILMIMINVLTVETSAFWGLAITLFLMLGSLLFTYRLESNTYFNNSKEMYSLNLPQGTSNILKPFLFLCIFILIITINSGLMYQVVTPAFAHYELLTSYYWAIPYIVALIIIRNMPEKINKAYFLYIAMIMIGLSFISFMWLEISIPSYLLINTLMLGAFGVCDLFWWSILGNIFDYYHNPAQVFGIGMSMNVLGIIIGGVVGNQIFSLENGNYLASIIALIVIFIVMTLLPLLNKQLTKLLKAHPFIIHFATMGENLQDKALDSFKSNNNLTDKEIEVVKLLLRGYTYKAMSESLFISENTLKYHIKNIYQKLNINSKMELIKIFIEK